MCSTRSLGPFPEPKPVIGTVVGDKVVRILLFILSKFKTESNAQKDCKPCIGKVSPPKILTELCEVTLHARIRLP